MVQKITADDGFTDIRFDETPCKVSAETEIWRDGHVIVRVNEGAVGREKFIATTVPLTLWPLTLRGLPWSRSPALRA